ncbi:MAG TPA: hypothetical protein VG370_10965 [Chloroflexota bacterium]|jgi:hypothetical protein|nr:hypothetical protein [Chloroflexota bacterium]
MPRHGATVADELLWVDASTYAPCPCCGATAACSVLQDEEFVRCRTVVSRWPVADGGWLHRACDLTAPARQEGASAVAAP